MHLIHGTMTGKPWQDSMDEMVDIYEETEEEWDRLQNEGAWEEAKDALERMKAYEEEIRNLQEMIQSEMGAAGVMD